MLEEPKSVKGVKPGVSITSSTPPIAVSTTKRPNPKPTNGPGWGLTVLLAFVAGVLGAALFVRFMPVTERSAIEQSKQVTLQENSATIDLVKKVGPSVVSINTSTTVQSYFGAQEQQGAGTGVIVTSDGIILTNKHVVEGASTVNVTNTEGKQYEGKILAIDSANDIAFVKVDATDLPAADLGDSDKVEVGQRAIAIGNALGEYSNTVTTGVISGKQRPVQASDGQGRTETLTNLFQTDAAINPGNSGGPLLNIDAQVIGINTAVASGNNAQNIGFAIPINQIKSALESVKTRGIIVRPYIGVRYVMLTESFAERNQLPVKEGALLRGDDQTLAVIVGSPAAKAGLREGDIITKVNNVDVTRDNPLQSVIVGFSPGNVVSITYWRDGREETVDVKLEEAPQAVQ
jgi:serine protease Do